MTRALLLSSFVLIAACGSAQTADEPVTRVEPARTAAAPDPQAARNVLADLPHQRVDYWIERFSRGDKRPEIVEGFRRMPEFESMIREKLRARNMPEDLVYLAMAESGFNSQAHSAAGARGIWQLVPDTAKRHGLRVDDTVDERLDAAKSTEAALAYLDKLYERFGSWYLAAAAYNTGENRIARLLLALNENDRGSDADYYRIWNDLPGETRDYVPAAIALRRLGSDRAKYGF